MTPLRPGLFTAPTGPATPLEVDYANPPALRDRDPEETPPVLRESDWVYVGVACRPEHAAEVVAKLTSLLDRMLRGKVPRISVDVRVSSRVAPGSYAIPGGMGASYWPRGADRFGADPTVLAWLSEQVRRELEGA